MSTTINTTAAPAAPTSSKLPVFSTQSAMALMWEKSCKTMTAKELEWFAGGAIEQVGMNIRALASVIEDTACLVSSDETAGSFQDTGSTSSLLHNLHNQLDTIAGLASIADDAGYRVRLALKGQQ